MIDFAMAGLLLCPTQGPLLIDPTLVSSSSSILPDASVIRF